MIPCDCYRDGRCLRTKEVDPCGCDGDKAKCSFYKNVRNPRVRRSQVNKVKKRTLIDKCRDAYRAFRGKQIGSLTFGINVKKCHECEYKNRDRIWYLCDRQACKNGCNPDCEHTSDIRHAKNFKDLINDGTYWEVEHE